MITIGIPVYNQAEFLPDAIESALAQTVPCEVIVVDDGSTDGSLEIALRYPVKVVHQVNKGLASARNTAIMNMLGDYFLPLDADDILKENCVERIEQKIHETKADIVMFDFKCFGIHNQTMQLGVPTIEAMATGNRLAYCSAIKKEALLECGGYSPRMTWGYEDFHLWFDLMKRGKVIAHIPEVLFLYRTKEVSMITTALQHHDELLNQIQKDHDVFA